MAIPSFTQTVTDGALGIVATSDRVSAAVGPCSAGTANTIYAISDATTIPTVLGTGPLASYVAYVLAVGGGTVLAVPAATSAGSAGSVTHTGTGVCVVSISGTPLDSYNVKVTVVAGGTNPAAGTATFTYSLDGGNTSSPIIAVPTGGSYAITGTGLTLAFSAASLVAGDTYTFTCTAPSMSTGQVTSAINALTADARTWKFVMVVGVAADAPGTATLAGVLDSLMSSAESAYRYTYAMCSSPDLGDGTAGDSALVTAFASFTSRRVSVGAGYCDLVDPLTARVSKRPAQWAHAARRHKAPISEDSARVLSGPLPGVQKIYRDEFVNQALDAARFVTLRTVPGQVGFFVTNGNLMSPVGSDFDYCQKREVMDVACAVNARLMLAQLSNSFRVNPAGVQAPLVAGGIDERDARALESAVGQAEAEALLRTSPQHVSAVSVTVNRTDNILSTKRLRSTVRVTPLGYAKAITSEIGFSNPALSVS